MALFLIVALVNLLIARSSGYNPMGRHDTIHFVISYPLIEEAVFRGLMLPILSNSTTSVLPLTIVGLPVKYTVLITAFLFAICHLQYYKLSRMSIRFMMFAFSGGIFFGIIADQTKSILLPIILHIEFNALSVYFSRRKIS
ncbi:CPBP family intramembrane glutamic endopeptidase [Paenibacillus sp. J2TS4]|uniref:CPBP family intramembrane glutamic endopeptidase n=1 Tax=Paenibacillus sp. J2TS4 TaxID=2807194 RepID=UPI00279621DA|nr:CPBP family intramembrane glutamic endopeptidase [Paenibacillus sp. J2TS4]